MGSYSEELLGTKQQKTPSKSYSDELLSVAAPQTEEIDKSRPASFATLSKAAMVDDPQTKISVYAKARFPNDPEAVKRYGIIGNDVVYRGDDGKIYQETPSGAGGLVKGFAAQAVGKAPALAGGVTGAVMGAPLGIVGAVPGAILGAMGGEGVRKIVGNLAFDEPQTPVGNFKSMAGEGAYAAMGEMAGAGVVKGLERNLAKDFSRYNPQTAADLQAKGQRLGVDLFPAQTTNLRSLKGRHEALARMDQSADIVSDATQKQAEQANQAAYKYFGTISPGGMDIGEKAQEAALSILEKKVAVRARKARPLYKKAFANPVETTPELAALVERPSMLEAVNRAKKLAAEEGIKLDDPKNTMQGLHYVKMALDGIIDRAPATSEGNSFARLAMDTREKLLSFMDTQSKDYAAARRLYAGDSKDIDKVQAGLVGDLARREKRLDMGARELFATNQDPAAIRFARREFEKQGKGAEWDSLVRAYLQDTFEQAGKFDDGITNQAPRWRKAMVGNPRQKEVLRNALSPQQYDALLDLADVFEAISRVKTTGNSMTMPLQESAKALRMESEGITGKALSPIQSIKDWVTEARMGKHAEQLAKLLTTPGDLRKLKQLRNLSDNDKKLIGGASTFFGLSAAPSSAEEVPLQQETPRVRQ